MLNRLSRYGNGTGEVFSYTFTLWTVESLEKKLQKHAATIVFTQTTN
jgi:hypothetical protein